MTYKICRHCNEDWDEAEGLAFENRWGGWDHYCAHCCSELFRRLSQTALESEDEIELTDEDWSQ